MPYTSHNWINGDSANTTKLNNLETQYTEATLSFGPDVFTAGFVLTGFTAAKDGSVANQLDVAAGTAYLLQTDGTTRQRKTTTQTTQVTSALSSTYHLYLQPDGTWYWNTANSPAANSLAICNVTTDGSGNIATVTDARSLNPTLFPNMAGKLTLPALASLSVGAGNTSLGNGNVIINSVGVYNSNSGFGKIGNQVTAGSFGVPVVVAIASRVNVTNTTQATILSFTAGTTGIYRASAYFIITGTNNGTILFFVSYTDPDFNGSASEYFAAEDNSGLIAPMNAAHTVPRNLGPAVYGPTFAAKAGTTIAVKYTNSAAGTISDFVSAVVEQLN